MKVKSALKQSQMHAKFLAVVLLGLLGVLAFYRHIAVGIFAALAALGLCLELVNIVFIRRRSSRDPQYLERKIE